MSSGPQTDGDGGRPAVVPPCSREALLEHPHSVLKDEGEHAARVLRVELPDGPVVYKQWRPARSRIMRLWAGVLMRREARHYAALLGVPGIPRFRGAYADGSFLIAFVEARPLNRGLPSATVAAALDDLEVLLDRLAERRFVHLDLHQKLNLMIDADGRIWLIDLGQGLDCSRSWWRRALFPWLHRIDRAAVAKFRARYAPDSFGAEVSERDVGRHARKRGRRWKGFHRRLREWLLGRREDGSAR